MKLPVGKIVPLVIQALAVFGGASAGIVLKSSFPASDEAAAGHEDDHGKAAKAEAKGGHGDAAHADKPKDKHAAKKDKHGDDKAAQNSHGGGHGAPAAETTGGSSFMKFSRQFVVPVITASGVRSLVVMDINIEVPPGMEESIYTREPKLRDSMLATLLSLSNRGAFNQNLLDAANLDTIRSELLRAARTVVGEDAENVLILNITRQDV